MEAPFVNIHTHRPTGRHIEPSAIGIHPWDAADGDLATVEQHIDSAMAVGEIGLDYLHGHRERQEKLFIRQLAMAETHAKPVILHCVRAFEPTMRLLKGFRLPAVLFHGFIGSPQQAAQAVAAGYLLSFGMRSFASPRTVRAMRQTPPERLFLETDDDPAPIETVYARAAELLEMPLAKLRQTIYGNYRSIFPPEIDAAGPDKK